MNILVLDDDENIHAYYRHILKQIKGAGIITTVSSSIAFGRSLKMNNYHVILCDIHMEPLSGPDILRAYKGRIAGKEIIMLSCADKLQDESNSLIKDGINVRACFQKPLVPQDLFDLLECN